MALNAHETDRDTLEPCCDGPYAETDHTSCIAADRRELMPYYLGWYLGVAMALFLTWYAWDYLHLWGAAPGLMLVLVFSFLLLTPPFRQTRQRLKLNREFNHRFHHN